MGCVLALQARTHTGRGQLCETSLLQSAIALQAGEFNFYEGRPDLENGVPEYRGSSALSRAYRCAGGSWLFLAAAASAQWDSLIKVTGLNSSVPFDDAARAASEGPLAESLAHYFAALDRAATLAALNEAGIPAVPLNRWADLFTEPQVLENHLVMDLPHASWGSVTQTGILAQFSGTPGFIDRAAPLLGEHSDRILSEDLGYSADRIVDLRKRRIIR
jgi:crotonobetainyl-CoA:carnitine CoA-transferase CaiB-like acyl-CoA transferase